jgi:uncharacterized protein YndB with AHSA1/START domain
MRRPLVALLIVAALGAVAVAPLPFRLATTIDSAASIARPPEVVFAYVTTPGNWPAWHPSSLGVSGAVDHPLQLGERVTEDFRVAGHRGRAVWTVIAREAPRRWAIEGEIRGRRAGVVSYTLTPSGAGTEFHRRFVYSSPNLLFAVLNRLRFRAQVEAESAEAVRRLKEVLEGTTAERSGSSASSASCPPCIPRFPAGQCHGNETGLGMLSSPSSIGEGSA